MELSETSWTRRVASYVRPSDDADAAALVTCSEGVLTRSPDYPQPPFNLRLGRLSLRELLLFAQLALARQARDVILC